MRKIKGFTLAEMVAVIAILMFLAALSTPFVMGYIDDAYNGKALIYLRELYEASLNFEKDYPGTTISDVGSDISSCDVDAIYNAGSLKPSILEVCNYLRPLPGDLEPRYTFRIGKDVECDISECKEARASMFGEQKAGIYKNKCACVNSLGQVCKQNSDEEQSSTCL